VDIMCERGVVFESPGDDSSDDIGTSHGTTHSRSQPAKEEVFGSVPADSSVQSCLQSLARLQAEMAELVAVSSRDVCAPDGHHSPPSHLGATDNSEPAMDLRKELQRIEHVLRGIAGSGTAGARRVISATSPETRCELSGAPGASRLSSNAELARLESIERSLAQIERQAGIFDYARRYGDLHEAVRSLQHRISVADGVDKELFKRSVQKTSAEVEKLLQRHHQLEGVPPSPNMERKADALYELWRQRSAAASSVPLVLSRLQALHALHKERASFVSRITALECQQGQLRNLLATTSAAMEKLSVEFESNVASMGQMMVDLERKMP